MLPHMKLAITSQIIFFFVAPGASREPRALTRPADRFPRRCLACTSLHSMAITTNSQPRPTSGRPAAMGRCVVRTPDGKGHPHMQDRYDPHAVERTWQTRWESEN